jgi:hypothetical protein
VLVPISILAIVGITVVLFARWSDPSSARDVLVRSGITAAAHGGLLSLAAWLASVSAGFEGVIAPDLGLGAATGRVGISLHHPPLAAFLIGAIFGAAFAAAGGISSLRIRASLEPQTRVLLLGWMRGLGAAALIVTTLLALGAVVALAGGRAPGFALFALGGYMLWANAVAAAIVLVHGPSMVVALDAGPFTGWERMDLLHFGAGSSPKVLVLGALVPVAAGVVAGRFCRRRSSLSGAGIALRFGALWGLTLALLALLLRVRVLSSFSVGSVDLGGGGAAVDPLVALVLGFVWGTATAYIGALTTRAGRSVESIRGALSSLARSDPSPSTWSCPACGMPNATEDRFCVSCAAVNPSARADL